MDPMRWNEYVLIAESLEEHYPDADLVLMTDDELVQLVRGLPGFSGKEQPPPEDILTAILAVWSQLRSETEDNDSRWDAYV
jgi:FeS assembly protein IscX